MARDNRLDFIKAVLILGVVYGHLLNLFRLDSGVSFWLHTVIRTFDMPMFMMIGGYLLSKSVSKYHPFKYILNKVSNLLFPLVFWNLIFKIFVSVVNRKFDLLSLFKSVEGYWFIWSIFICSVTFILLSMMKSINLQIFFALLIEILFCLIPTEYDFANL
ncbi:MAG: acyltransferase family protein [Clostridia bacterium]|nr:acyltransferase family protein [Clostridia bacterium]